MAFNQNEAFESDKLNADDPSSSSLPPAYSNPPYYYPQGQAPPFSAPPYQPNPSYGMTNGPPSYAAAPPGFDGFYPQQQQVIVVGGQPVVSPVMIVPPQSVSMVGAIVMSCIVYWLCGFLFGGIAFILAMVGKSSAASGDILGAIRMRNASYSLSAIGIIVAFVVIGSVVGLIFRLNYFNDSYRTTYYRTYYYYY